MLRERHIAGYNSLYVFHQFDSINRFRPRFRFLVCDLLSIFPHLRIQLTDGDAKRLREHHFALSIFFSRKSGSDFDEIRRWRNWPSIPLDLFMQLLAPQLLCEVVCVSASVTFCKLRYI